MAGVDSAPGGMAFTTTGPRGIFRVSRALRALSSTYVYLFRGTPMLIQLIFWFNAVPIMFKTITIWLPFMDAPLVSMPTTAVVTPFIAALAGLSLAEGAYMSEIIRGGILAVDQGQRSAARALGIPSGSAYRHLHEARRSLRNSPGMAALLSDLNTVKPSK